MAVKYLFKIVSCKPVLASSSINIFKMKTILAAKDLIHSGFRFKLVYCKNILGHLIILEQENLW